MEYNLNNVIKTFKKQQRNSVCLCGSGLKFKNCCGPKQAAIKQLNRIKSNARTKKITIQS